MTRRSPAFLLSSTLACAALAPLAGAQSILFTVDGDSASDVFGQSIDVVGDVDGDGFDDIMVGAWRDDPGGKTDAGTVRVVSGLTGATLFTIPGDLANDHMGFGSSGAGDANGDGFADVLAAADEADVAGIGANAGNAKIVSGATGLTLWTLTGDTSGDLFGWSAADAGDVDGDGSSDSVLGSLNDDDVGKNNCGSAAVFSGATGQLLFKVLGGAAADNLGDAVGGAGDVNNDGFADVIAGAPNADPGGLANAGRATVVSGATGAVLFHVDGDTASDALGGSVAGAGDVDLDGFDDVIVGAGGDDVGATNSGSAKVISGATQAIVHAFAGDSAGDNLGGAVAGAGDVDGDGTPDLVAGAVGDDDNGASCGAVRVYSGKSGAVLATFYGDSASDQLGVSVAGGGDLNGDGFDDVAGGAIGDDNTAAGAGSARAYSLIPEGVAVFGAGTAGCAGRQLLNANAVAHVGDAGFGLIGSAAPQNSLGYLLIADAANVAGAPGLGTGAILHVALPPAATFLLLGFSGSDANGSLFAPVPLPNLGSIAGVAVTFQNLSVWPSPCPGLGPQNVSSSNGVTVVIQP